MQDGKFRACCCSKIVVKLHCKFVLYVGYRRIHQVLLRAQQDFEVMKRRRETDAISQTPKPKTKRTTREQRETACETEVPPGSTVFILTSRKTEIARSARGPKSQEPRAEGELAKQYLELKSSVI